MEKRKLSQVALCQKSGISQATLSRYLSARLRPRRAFIEKLGRAFNRNDRAELLAAHVRDMLPESMREKVREKDPRQRMPAELRRAFESLEAAAVERAEVAAFIKTSAKLFGK
jgi:transcriptional regulator with XRE-family HTH domain